MKKYQLLVFDWDGTLYDSGVYEVLRFQTAAQASGLLSPSKEAIHNLVGLRFDVVIQTLFPNLTSEQYKSFTTQYLEYAKINPQQPILFTNAAATLKALNQANYLLAIATSKHRRGLESDLACLNIKQLFVTTRCADESFSKPNPQMLLEIVDEVGIAKNEVLMIGDTEYDMQFALNAGVDALAVSYGMHKKETLLKHNVKGCLADISELIDWLKSNRRDAL